MSETSLYFILFVVIPAIFLVVGLVYLVLVSSHRKKAGIVMSILGIVETFPFLYGVVYNIQNGFVWYQYPSWIAVSLGIGCVTLFVGVISLFFPRQLKS
jgi:hypothetical protein